MRSTFARSLSRDLILFASSSPATSISKVDVIRKIRPNPILNWAYNHDEISAVFHRLDVAQ